MRNLCAWDQVHEIGLGYHGHFSIIILTSQGFVILLGFIWYQGISALRVYQCTILKVSWAPSIIHIKTLLHLGLFKHLLAFAYSQNFRAFNREQVYGIQIRARVRVALQGYQEPLGFSLRVRFYYLQQCTQVAI